MHPFLRMAAIGVAIIFAVMALSALAQAIYLGWAAVASPAVAALATALSYLAIAAIALAATRIPVATAPAARTSTLNAWAPMLAPLSRLTHDRPALAILMGLAAGAAAEHLQRRNRPRV